MKVFHSSLEAAQSLRVPLLVLGNFDGVHRAHQEMFRLARQEAQTQGLSLTAYTFEPHPVKLLSPKQAPPQITTLAQKLELLEKLQVDAVVVEPFTSEFAGQTAEDWFGEIVVRRLQTQALRVGYDFTFGKARSGNIHLLEDLCKRFRISLKVLAAQFIQGCLISSTQIRQSILHGDLEEATLLLGRYFFVDGFVVSGDGRGASLGFPTANLEVLNELLPPRGVYAGIVEYQGQAYPAVANLGLKPTFKEDSSWSFEIHLLDFSKDLRAEKLRFFFVSSLRPEKKFADSGQLIQQIQEDIREARNRLSSATLKTFIQKHS